MPRPRPLTPREARHSLANKLGIKIGDRLRQLNTKFGLRPQRVWLVWREWSGGERGQGDVIEKKRIEILPTPKADSLDSVTYSVFHAGTVPAGSIKLSEVSLRLTYDELTGHMLPNGELHTDNIPQPWEFYYELVEDGRGDPEPVHQRYRILSYPFRKAGAVMWSVMLERISEDDDRQGKSAYTTGAQG